MRAGLSVSGLAGATVVLASAIILPGSWFSYEVAPKAAVLFCGTAACLALALFRRQELVSKSRIQSLFLLLIAASAIWAIVNTVFSDAPLVSLAGTAWRRLGLLELLCLYILATLVVTEVTLTAAHAGMVLRIIATGGIPICVYGILQYLGIDPLLETAAYENDSPFGAVYRVPASLVHATYFANFCVHIAIAGAFTFFSAQSRRGQLLGLLAFSSASIALYCSGARGGLLGLAIALGFVVWREGRSGRRVIVTGIGISLAGSIVLLLLFPQAWNRTRGRVYEATHDFGGPRLLNWRDSLRLASFRPWLGHGIETYGTSFSLAQSEELAERYPDQYHESPHNMFLDALTAQGILGLILQVALLVVAMRAGFAQRDRYDRERRYLAASIAGSVVAHQFICFILPTSMLLWISMACLVGLSSLNVFLIRRVLPIPVLLASALIYLGVGVCTGWVESTLMNCRMCIQEGDWPCAKEEWRLASTMWPIWNSQAWLWYARNLLAWAREVDDSPARLELLNESGKAAQSGLTLADDRADAFFVLSEIGAERGDVRAVELNLRAAVNAAPNWYKPHVALALVLETTERQAEAVTEIRKAERLTGGKVNGVSDIRRRIEDAMNQ
jgi:O-antigen ligase